MKLKGFTLIELVIVMVILAILVTLGVPKFLGQSDKAQKAKLISDGRVLEDGINRYYIDHGDWPRLTPEDQPLTDAELTSKLYALNDKGFNAPLAPEEGAKYYDINLEVLKPYIKSFSSDVKHFVLQNPVGSVYVQDPKENARLTKVGDVAVKEVSVTTRVETVVDGYVGGVASSSKDVGKVGESVTLTATPNEGFKFLKWINSSGDEVSQDSEASIILVDDLDGDNTYGAVFGLDIESQAVSKWDVYTIATSYPANEYEIIAILPITTTNQNGTSFTTASGSGTIDWYLHNNSFNRLMRWNIDGKTSHGSTMFSVGQSVTAYKEADLGDKDRPSIGASYGKATMSNFKTYGAEAYFVRYKSIYNEFKSTQYFTGEAFLLKKKALKSAGLYSNTVYSPSSSKFPVNGEVSGLWYIKK